MRLVVRLLLLSFICILILGCRALVGRENIPDSETQRALNLMNVVDAWGVLSYQSPEISSDWIVEAYDKRMPVGEDICMSRFMIAEVRREGSKVELVKNQVSRRVAIKSCDTANRDDFIDLSGDVNVVDLPFIIKDIRKASRCLDGCLIWKEVSVDNIGLLNYISNISSNSLFSIERQDDELILYFGAKELNRIIACYIRWWGDGQKSLRVVAQPIG